MRKETSNQFTEGLVSDLNPINTPNTVLTDNLNGTLITYNGNEFSLQNDQGNYELKNCRLPANYIPVGIKEYGDILYIVSYNPITEKVQIGSYPSPLTYESTEGLPCDKTIDSAIKKLIKDDNKSIKYSELLKELDGIIFNEERLKLNPGDQYKLLRTNEWDYHFENIDYKILNDESYYQDVTNLIKINQKNYEYVPWTTPGFLAINSVLADIKIHGLNIKYFYIDEDALKNKSFHFSFSIQLNVEDKHLKTEIENWIKKIENNQTKDYQRIAFDFSLYEKYEKDGEAVENELFHETDVDFFTSRGWKNGTYAVESGKYGYSEWYDDFIYLWKNIKGECRIEDFDRTIIVKITPIFYDKNDDKNVRIEFDNLQQTLEFNLAEAEKGTYQLGDELFQFKVDPETKKETIAFNTKSPLVTDGEPRLKYRLYGFYTEKETEWELLSKEFGWDNRSEHKIDLNETILGVEDAGYIEFQIETNAGPKNLGKRIIITSEYLNEFYDRAEWPVFDKDISLNDWLCKYFDESQIDCILGNKEEYRDKSIYTRDIDKFYLNEFGSTFFTDDNELQTHYYWRGWCYSVEDVTIKFPEKTGNLWKEKSNNYFWYKNLQGDSTSDPHLYKVKQLECEFIRKAEAFAYIPDVKFVPLKPEIDNLNIIVNGTWITISYNNSEYYKELNADSDDYYWGKSNNLEGWIKSKGEYERVMLETKIGDTGIDDDLSTDTGGDKEDGENGGDNSKPEDNNTGQTDTVLYWNEPDIFSTDVPCRLLKVQLKFSSPNKNKIWFGAIKKHPSIDDIPRDSTISPYWESEVTDSKTYYFLMLWGGEYYEVGSNRVAGSYVLVPFEEDISNVENLYRDKFCPKLIQSKTDNDESTQEKCYCYNLSYNEEEKLANTITWSGMFNLGIEDISNDNNYKYRNILTPDNKFNDMSGNIKYNFSKEFTYTVNDDLSDFNFEDMETLIDEINQTADENYNKWIENPLTDFGQISRDRWICLDKNLKNDFLKEELTRKLDRTYSNRHLITYTNTDNSTLPDRIKLKPSTTSWACARMSRKDTAVNAVGKKNFVTIGTAWGNDDSTPKHYIINDSNWLS